MAMPAMAKEQAAERIRQDGWRVESARRMTMKAPSSRIGRLLNIDNDVADEVFLPSRADLYIEELQQFIRENHIGRPAARGRA